MSPMLHLSVPAPSRGERLDRFLARAQTDLSRSRLQALIRDGRVHVNGLPGRASQRLKDGDDVRLEVPAPVARPGLEPEPLPLAIVFEDDDVMVIDKPPGLVVHPGAGVERGTLVNAMLHHAPSIRHVGGAQRPGIVHRLDKDTSGLMVVAKSERAHRALVEAMRQRTVRRGYWALVWGHPRADHGHVSTLVGRDPKNRKRMAVVTRVGKPAVTHWSVHERFGPVTWIDARLETGRTHQIRVHLAHLGHPVVGDPVYGGRAKKQLSLRERERSLAADLLECLPRQALHAYELAFVHPVTGEEQTFTSPPPADLARALEHLRAFVRDLRN